MTLPIRAKHVERPLQIAVVDYGMGNLGSVRHALTFLGHQAHITSDVDAITAADAVVLPGVGAFGLAVENLHHRKLAKPLSSKVVDRRAPFLGICLGMQLIAREGMENGRHAGLGWIDGEVIRLEGESRAQRVPHVGWAPISAGDLTLFDTLADGSAFYFDHSYHLQCPATDVAARCRGEFSFVAAVRRDNIFATQFHPEKSQRSGLRLLRNFTNYAMARRDGPA